MLVKLNFNPEQQLISKDRENVLKSLEETCSKEVYEFYRDSKVKDVLTEIVPGIYEYFDVNDPEYHLIGQKLRNTEQCPLERAKLLKKVWRDLGDLHPHTNKIYVSYPYGVCDNYQQIIEREEDIYHYMNSDEKFCIVMTPIRKEEQPEEDGWRWGKWGNYIGDRVSEAEYLYDEPNVDLVYVYQIYKIEDDV